MFKQFLKWVLVITSAVTVFLWLFFMIDRHNNVMNQSKNNLDNFYIQLGLPIKATTNAKYKKIVDDISETSKQLNIPFLKRTNYKGGGLKTKKVDYAKYIDDTVFEVSDLNSSDLANIFKIKLKNGNEYSTKNLKDSVPLIKYGNADFTVKKINARKLPEIREGLFYLQTLDITAVEKFRKLLSKKLNKDLGTKLSERDFKVVEVPNVDESSSIDFRQLAITMTFFQLIVIMIYCLSISRELGIYRLLGYTIATTLKQIAMPWLILGSGIGFTLTLIPELVNRHFEMLWPLFSLTCMIMIIFSLVIFVVAVLLKVLPTSRLLIKRTYAKIAFILLYIMKGILLTFVLASALPLGNLMYQYVTMSVSDKKSSVYDDYATFFPSVIGYNQDDLVNPDNTLKLLNGVIYSQISKNDGILVDTTGITGRNSEGKQQYQLVTINANYLNFNPIYKSNGARVEEKDVNRQPSILLSNKYKSNLKLQAQINKYLSKSFRINKARIIYINDSQSIIDESGKKIKNYGYIYVRSSHAFNGYGNIFTGDGKDPLKIALHGKTPEEVYNNKYKTLFEKYNLTDNFPQLIRVSDVQLNLLQQEEGNAL
ncbi:hypothetical protein [Lactobacillus xylocopicola]|uniref:Bacteriocin-associated integral membrane family protein n=1 Tax=Lactobacillus xylocopicola TaxID=2976676 RepID=A0ABM8BEV1_9LACO|nr:hypothetical protein [Lactobacillus xylocopicola]BDR59761.1 hypothetical protein KIM322_00220 [Lactobacillus xylocopicola]